MQLGFEVLETERADGVDGTRLEPRIATREERGDRLLGGLERRANDLVRERDAFVDAHLAVEERDEHPPQLRFQNVVQELERIRADRRAGRTAGQSRRREAPVPGKSAPST